MSGPLEGIKVVEFGQNLAGPYCGQILAGPRASRPASFCFATMT
jgi:CoA-transferase family III